MKDSAADNHTGPSSLLLALVVWIRRFSSLAWRVCWTAVRLICIVFALLALAGFVSAPNWGNAGPLCVFIALALLSVRGLIQEHTWRRPIARTTAGQCLNCGYDLRATPDRCPECGAIPAKGAG